MQLRGTPLHIGLALLAVGVASPVTAQDGGILPPGCGTGGGWGTNIGSVLPANIPALHVNIYGPASDTGTLALLRRTASGDVAIEADVTSLAVIDRAGTAFHSYVVAPRAALEPGEPHAFQWTSDCLEGVAERTFEVVPAEPLPALPATVTATLIQTVRDGRREDTFVRVDLQLSANILPWIEALSFDVVVDDTQRYEMHLPFESTTLLRRELSVVCPEWDVRTGDIEEGTHDFRAEVGGFGVLTPVLETSTSAVIDCASRLYLHARTEVPLTPEEIEALPGEDPPPGGDGGSPPDAAVTAEGDAGVSAVDGGPSPAPSGCSVSFGGTPSSSTTWLGLLALIGLVVRVRSSRR